jgi:glycolate oxidase FAD binding subunit
MTEPQDPALQALIDRIRQAGRDKTPLAIQGGNTKAFYGEPAPGEPLDVRPLAGISSYEPTELVVTARAGTPLAELEMALAERGQWLPFEPLGLTLLNGRGELLSFGGQVMKNVAGYDVSRLVAGSLGILGVICEVSLKVMPLPPAQATLRFELDEAAALKAMNTWAGQPLPLQASAWWEGMLVVRLAGAAAAVNAAAQQLGGEIVEPQMAAAFWQGLRDHRDEFFIGAAKAVDAGAALWRLSLPSTAAPLNLSGEQLVEWGGAQRWLCTSTPAAVIRAAAEKAGGHATLFRARDKSAGVFAPLAPTLDRIHRELKRAFDPDNLLNPGRLYPGL